MAPHYTLPVTDTSHFRTSSFSPYFPAGKGLGTVAAVLPKFQIPLFLIALALGVFSIGIFIKRKNALATAICSVVLGAGSILLVWQMFAANQCASTSMVSAPLRLER